MTNPPIKEIKRRQPSPIPSIVAEPIEIDCRLIRYNSTNV